MPTWNDQQMKAITTKQKNILVSASAGSGKTTVLIARLLDLVIKDRISIDQILAMTFTEAAANEMKKRLAAELHRLLNETEDEKEQAYITRQLTGIQNAHISTIHSFCLSILQDYYYMLGWDGERASNIMDNASMERYQRQAMETAMKHQLQHLDDTFQELTMMFSSRAESNDALFAAIRNLAVLASSKPDPEAWLHTITQSYGEFQSILDYPQEIAETFFDYLHTRIIMYEEALRFLYSIFMNEYSQESKKIDALNKKMNGLNACKEALKQLDYTAFRSAFQGICHIVPPATPNKDDQRYASIRKQILSIEDSLLEQLFEERDFLKQNSRMKPYIERLVQMCLDYRKAYQNIKEQQNVIDFDDMEHYALQILEINDRSIAKQYQKQFVEIMVDEFQDSNDVQNELVMRICRDNNVFRVGDIKQSIYGFRHAKPQLMQGLIAHRGEKDEVIYLSNNYRSKKMIVDFNNELFRRLMNLDGFSCSYAKEDDVETGIPAQQENNVPIQFHLIDHTAIKEQNDLIVSKHDLKASYIANQIVEIKEKEQRCWKDFVVLVRGNALKDRMKAAFDEVNIPYFIDIKHGFYQSSAVQIVLSFLKALLHPHDDISFIAVISSPIFQMDMETLALMKQKKEKDQSYYAYCKEHFMSLLESFEECRKQMYHCSLSETLNQIYDMNHFYQEHTSIQEKTNLDLLFEKAVRFEEQEAKGIAAFMEQIASIQDAQTAEAIPIGSDEDVVRVMSIHQSKGLQFPVVFLWSNTSQIPIEFKELFITDSELGIGMKSMELPQRFVKTTVQRIAMEHKKNKEELEEEMRILYVATTRAQQQMHIVDCIKSRKDYDQPLTMSSVFSRNGYTSWILQAFDNTSNDLVQMRTVGAYWKTETQSIQQPLRKKLPVYEKKQHPIHVTTASSMKKGDQKPKLNFHDTSVYKKRGTMLHKAIEECSLPYSYESITQYFQKLNYEPDQKDLEGILALGEQSIYQKACSYEKVFHELPFMVKYDNEILHGYMDFAAIQDNHIIIIDFKSDHLYQKQEYLDQYAKQLHTYHKAMSLMYPRAEIQMYIYSILLKEMISVSKE